MSRLLSNLLEYINVITAILAIMGMAALVTLLVVDPTSADGLFFDVLVLLVIIVVVNSFIAAFMSARRSLAALRDNEKRQMELLRTIEAFNAPPNSEAQKKLDLKYPTTDL